MTSCRKANIRTLCRARNTTEIAMALKLDLDLKVLCLADDAREIDDDVVRQLENEFDLKDGALDDDHFDDGKQYYQKRRKVPFSWTVVK